MQTKIESLESAIEDIKLRVGNIPYSVQATYCNGIGARSLYIEKEANFKKLLVEHSAPQPLQLGNSLAHTNQILQASESVGFANAKIMMDLVQAMPEFIAAEAQVQPLLDEIASLQAELAKEREILGSKQHALNEAREAAAERARIAAENDPEVIAAAKALALALEKPQALKKGKVESGT
jgi:hypothetical protein